MRTESTVQAMIVVLSAMFESLPPEVRRRAVTLIEDCEGFVDDLDAKALMATYDLTPVPVMSRPKRRKAK